MMKPTWDCPQCGEIAAIGMRAPMVTTVDFGGPKGSARVIGSTMKELPPEGQGYYCLACKSPITLTAEEETRVRAEMAKMVGKYVDYELEKSRKGKVMIHRGYRYTGTKRNSTKSVKSKRRPAGGMRPLRERLSASEMNDRRIALNGRKAHAAATHESNKRRKEERTRRSRGVRSQSIFGRRARY